MEQNSNYRVLSNVCVSCGVRIPDIDFEIKPAMRETYGLFQMCIRDSFNMMEEALGKIDIVAADLGTLTPDVTELMEQTGYPGMKVLEFACDSGEENDYLPHKYTENCVVYTGTLNGKDIACLLYTSRCV